MICLRFFPQSLSCLLYTSGTALGNNDSVRAGAFGGAENGAQVVRILQFVRDDDKRGFPALLRKVQDFIHRDIFLNRGGGNDALVDSAAAEGFKLSVIGLLNDRPGGPGLGCKCAEAFGGRGILGLSLIHI